MKLVPETESKIPYPELNRDNTIVLFDVDGTLTKPRNKVTLEMLETLAQLRMKVTVGIVGGSDHDKIKEQLGDNLLQLGDYIFSENGLLAFHDAKEIHRQSLKDALGEEKLKKFINFTLKYIADLDIPIKRGTFIEFRNGMMNVSPIGRNCSQQEREDFNEYDKVHNIRKTMVSVLQKEFQEFNLKYSIGGQISFDVFPVGWDKTYCLRHLPEDKYKYVFFYGDKTDEGGNDHEIYAHPRTYGTSVAWFTDTIEDLNKKFLKN